MKTDIKKLLKQGKMGEHLKKLKAEAREKMIANPDEEVLDIYQASWLLQLKPVAVRNAVKNGVIPCLKIGNRLRFSKKALLESLDVKRNLKD